MMAEGIMKVWETVWQMSLTGGFVCLLICALRLALKKAPKSYAYALWAVVFLRWICPVALTGSVSVIPQWETVGESIQEWVHEHNDQDEDTSDGYLNAGGDLRGAHLRKE